ncbi:hypothetical protein ACOSP7_004730 [Xanthoceras sorbifolium]
MDQFHNTQTRPHTHQQISTHARGSSTEDSPHEELPLHNLSLKLHCSPDLQEDQEGNINQQKRAHTTDPITPTPPLTQTMDRSRKGPIAASRTKTEDRWEGTTGRKVREP